MRYLKGKSPDGCEICPHCEECPLHKCIYDEPRGLQKHYKAERDTEIRKLCYSGSKSQKEVALAFNISIRTVRRALKKGGDANDISV